MSSVPKRKFILRCVIGTVVTITVLWTVLTLYVEQKGPAQAWQFGSGGNKMALVIFDPDPFYNLDEQVSKAIGEALAKQGITTSVKTVAAAEADSVDYDLIIFCANTYNWRPDWAITSLINAKKERLRGRAVVAVTLGAGSTEASQRSLEEMIIGAKASLVHSYSLWLWRPNDETKLHESNVQVAVAMAYQWGEDIAKYSR